MSEYHSLKTEYNDAECLVKALGNMGYTEVEVSEVAQHLFGYHGDKRPEKANIIVRRKYVGSAANDIGFVKTSGGTYEAIISEFDSHKHNASWLTKLKQHYVEERFRKVAKQNGLVYLANSRKVVNGKIQFEILDSRSN